MKSRITEMLLQIRRRNFHCDGRTFEVICSTCPYGYFKSPKATDLVSLMCGRGNASYTVSYIHTFIPKEFINFFSWKKI